MSIGITLALLAAVGYGTADFVGGAGARRAPTMSIVFIGQVTGAVAMLLVGLASPGTPTLAHAGWALLAGLGSAAGSIFLLRGLSRGRMAVVAPTSAVGAAVLPVLAGLASWRSAGQPGLDRPRPRAAGDLAGLAPGRERHGGLGRGPRRLRRRPAGRPRVRRALRGPRSDPRVGGHPATGPQPAHRSPRDRRRRDGAAPGVAAQQPRRRAGASHRACSGCRAPSRSSKPATSPTSVWSPCSPRSTRPSRCSWPAPCSASGSGPGSASGWCSAPRPWA